VLVVGALVLAACGDDREPSSAGTTGPVLEGEITVAAAASLTEPFTALGTAFEAEHPGVRVTFTFDSSSTLARQVLDGAPVDVFASADQASTATLVDAELVEGEPTVFARNRLTIVTKPGNPTGITGLADLAGGDGVISLCGADVPCGRFAAQVLERAGIVLPEDRVTRGQNARATLAAVAEGDAVAGIVYVTDARSAGDAVDAVAIPAGANAVAVYPICVLEGRGSVDVAEAFVAFVRSTEGRRVLAAAGFLPPN
jgi:molybdate transport system substrate-binding protein